MAQEGLGNKYDVAIWFAPVDTNAGAITGKRVRLSRAGAIAAVLIKGAGTANDDPVLTVKQHTASTGGTTANLAVVDHYYLKNATTLAGSEAWTRLSQAAAATVSDPGGAGTSAESQQIVVVPILGTQLSDTYGWVSVDIADTGSAGAQLAAGIYILSDLAVQRTPANLANTLNG